MKVSILLLTINRYNLTREYVGRALDEAGVPFDLCITDNGSTEQNIFDWCEQRNPKVYNLNTSNQGTAQSLNRMIKQNPSDYYVFIGNDIELPKNWLKKMVEYNEAIPQSGVIGIDWRGKKYPKREVNGLTIDETSNVFGTMFVSQATREKVGIFCEDYGPYGLWDSDYSIRCSAAGLINYYLPGLKSEHFGNDVGQKDEYRKMKDESLAKASPIFNINRKRYEKGEWFI